MRNKPQLLVSAKSTPWDSCFFPSFWPRFVSVSVSKRRTLRTTTPARRFSTIRDQGQDTLNRSFRFFSVILFHPLLKTAIQRAFCGGYPLGFFSGKPTGSDRTSFGGPLGPPAERFEYGYRFFFLWSSLVGKPSPKKG